MSNEKKKEKYDIDAQLLQNLLDYLSTRPYHEVYELISALVKEANKQVEAEKK